MFTIIGSDGRPYGPVSLDQIRQWLSEGRATPQSLVQEEGRAEWTTVGAVLGSPEPGASPPMAAPTPPALRTGAENRIAAGVLGILLGCLGVHKFVLGYAVEGIIMLAVSLSGAILCWIPTFVMAVIGFVEGIIYLTKSDAEFVETYVRNKRGWF